MSPSKPAPLRDTDLDVNAVYRTPLGRLCRLVPAKSTQDLAPHWAESHSFRYVDGVGVVEDGFRLTRGAVRILQPAGWR